METREEIMKRDFSEEFVNKMRNAMKCLITNTAGCLKLIQN